MALGSYGTAGYVRPCLIVILQSAVCTVVLRSKVPLLLIERTALNLQNTLLRRLRKGGDWLRKSFGNIIPICFPGLHMSLKTKAVAQVDISQKRSSLSELATRFNTTYLEPTNLPGILSNKNVTREEIPVRRTKPMNKSRRESKGELANQSLNYI